MKDQLNDHTPRSDSWDKILGMMSFENQLEGHIQNLPQFEPNTESWKKINTKLEGKKSFAFWPYLGLAAGIIGILLISKFTLNNERNIEQHISDQNSPTEISAIDMPINMEFQVKSKPDSPETMAPFSKPKKITEPQKEELPKVSIEVPDLEFIAINSPLILPTEKDSLEEYESQGQSKTLHEVRISWRFKPTNFQVKTVFGKSDPVKLEEKQLGKSERSGWIRFRQKN